MSYYNPYLDDLKDERIEIIEEKLIGDTKHIYAVLHRKDVCTCPNCSSIHTISYGKRKRLINCDLFAHYKTNFVLEYRRFQCKDCNHVFNDSTNIVLKNERIAKSTKIQILLDLKEDHTFKYIAQKNNVSLQTVIDIFELHIKPVRKTLPEVFVSMNLKT